MVCHKKWRVTLFPSEVHSLPQHWSSEDLSSSHQLTVLRYFLVSCAPCPPSHTELLKSLKIDVDGPSSETLGNLTSLSLDTSLSLREEQAFTLNLACDNDSLDSRKKPLGIKLAEDVVTLIGCVKNSQVVPRSLLKNRKQSREYLDTQRKSEAALSSESSGTLSNPSLTSPAPSSQPQVIQSSESALSLPVLCLL